MLGALARAVGDLSPGPSSQEELDAARLAVARGLVADVPHGPVSGLPTGVSSSGGQVATADELASAVALASARAGEPLDVLASRRELPAMSASIPSWAAGRAVEQTLGPFADRFGRPVWIDLFRIVHTVPLVRSPGGTPFATVPIRGFLVGGESFGLAAGSIWFSSPLLAADAPADGLTGLRIRGGRLTIDQPAVVDGDELVVAPTASCRLELDLDPGAGELPGLGPAGADAWAAAAEPPSAVTLVFDPGDGRVESLADARVAAYGTVANLRYAGAAAEYAAEVNSLLVPMQTDTAEFAVLDSRSEIFAPSGSGAVAEAGWALPVAIADPGTLGDASGAGGLALRIGPGLVATWESQPAPAPLGPAAVVVEPGRITMIAPAANGLAATDRLELWPAEQKGPSAITIRYAGEETLQFVSEAAGIDTLLLSGAVDVSADRPLTVRGRRVSLRAQDASVAVWQEQAAKQIEVSGEPDAQRGEIFALSNALLPTGPPLAFRVTGTLDHNRLTQGALVIRFASRLVIPTLPDPYAANFSPFDQPMLRRQELLSTQPGSEHAGARELLAFVTWTPDDGPQLGFTGRRPLLPQPAARVPPDQPAGDGEVARMLVEDSARERALQALFDRALGGATGDLILLDVSTNADQLGVRFGEPSASDVRDLAPSGTESRVQGMTLESPASRVRLLTVPAVQWEPVVTRHDPNDPAFPTPLSFADNGVPTTIGCSSVELVPIAPLPALKELITGFADAGTPAAALFTLPFGIVALAELTADPSPAGFRAGLELNRPAFTAKALLGAHQVKIEALEGPVVPRGTPGLQGFAIQLRNGRLSGVPQGKSVLGTAEITFNANFAPGGAGLHKQVPVTRIDISGYGESTFSEWLNPDDADGIVTKATFDVIGGRTAYELIQIQSHIYPYGVKVIRSIVLRRENGGVVGRSDSGWQAVTEGRYMFPEPDLKTHSGVVVGVRDVVNIVETGQQYTTPSAVVMMAVRFDCGVMLEGAGAGSVAGAAPSRGQLGFVQMTPGPGARKAITRADYAQLIADNGPLGGAVDCLVAIGGSGAHTRVAHVGVGVTSGMGGPEFAMASWGSPVLPRGGQWSFTRRAAATDAPEPVESDKGVPLVRAGLASGPASSAPYRFADPADVNRPAAPAVEYGLLHATGTQRLLFPRPSIELGATAITSHPPSPGDPPVRPLLADPYALATGLGVFPRIADAIPIPDPSWALNVGPDANLSLELASPTFTVSFGPRSIASKGAIKSYVEYADAGGTPSVGQVQIDTAAAQQWLVHLSGVSFAMSAGALGEVIRVVADIDAQAGQPLRLTNAKVVLGGAFQPVQDVLEFLESLGLPAPLHASMSNDWKLQAGVTVPVKDKEGRDLTIPPTPPGAEDFEYIVKFIDAGLEVDETVRSDKGAPFSEGELTIGATVLIETNFKPLKAVGLFELKINLSTDDGTNITITWGAGLGVDEGVFTGYIVMTNFVIVGDSLGLGGGVIAKLSFDFKVIELDAKLEAKEAIVSHDCPPNATWGVAKASVAFHVTIALVIDIEFDYEWTWQQKIGGSGTCPLPDVV